MNQPYNISEPADPFATPLEILPEWYIFATFNILRVLPIKLIGILSMAYTPVLSLPTVLSKNINKFQNPLRRPVTNCVSLTSTVHPI